MAKYTLFGEPLLVPLENGLRIDATMGGILEIGIGETQHFAGLYDDSGNKLYTTIWGYGLKDPVTGKFTPTWPGPTILATEGKPLTITFHNELPGGGYPGGHLLPFDGTYHTIREAVEDRRLIPTNVHLHGGHTDADSDGFPETVFNQGESFANFYDNSQQAGTLWYHPHTLGRTRLDVYAGLAGFYLLRDENENELISRNYLPGGGYEIEMAIQDRMFTNDGQLYLPSSSEEFYGGELVADPAGTTTEKIPQELADLRQELMDFLETQNIPDSTPLAAVPEVTGLPEFFGDHIITNGVVWPHLEVTETQYRFRLLNGSDSRAYIFEIQDDQSGAPGEDRFPFYQIGTDVGLMERPVKLDRLVMMPGERADVVVDFKDLLKEDAARDGVADPQFYLRNFGPDDPFGGFADNTAAISTPYGFQNAELVDISDPATTGQVMRFDVTLGDAPQSRFSPYQTLNPSLKNIFSDELNEYNATYTRRLGLFEGQDEFGRLQPMLGSVEPILDQNGQIVNGSSTWADPTTEVIQLDKNGEATEIWEIWNLTGDAHPVHLHLTAFKVLDRTPFELIGELPKKPQVQHNGEYGSGFTFDAPDGSGRQYGTIDDIAVTGRTFRPQANEEGLKDTVIALPGQKTRIVAYFDKPGTYVWHCHILSHEDHDMMRTFTVVPHDENAPGKVIQGTEGRDRLTGTKQDDVIIGYGNNDFLRGNEGHDTFKYLSLDDGRDYILDFELRIDRIDLVEVLNEISYKGTDPFGDGVVSVDSYGSDNSLIQINDPNSGDSLAQLALLPDVKPNELLSDPSHFIFG